MATTYQHGIIFVCPVSMVSTVITGLDAVMPRSDGVPRDTAKPEDIGADLSASGTAPVTHYLSSFVITETTRLAFDSAGFTTLSGCYYWRTGNPSGLLVATNHTPSQANIGQAFSYASALTALSLQEIPPSSTP